MGASGSKRKQTTENDRGTQLVNNTEEIQSNVSLRDDQSMISVKDTGNKTVSEDESRPESGVIIRRLVRGRSVGTQTKPKGADEIMDEGMDISVPCVLTEDWQATGQTPGADPLITNYETPRNGNDGPPRLKTGTIQTQTSRTSDNEDEQPPIETLRDANDVRCDQTDVGNIPNTSDVQPIETFRDANDVSCDQTDAGNIPSTSDEQPIETLRDDNDINGDQTNAENIPNTSADKDGAQNTQAYPGMHELRAGFSPPNKVSDNFSEISLQRFGKYKVRLSSDPNKCIISAATFLDTGDIVVIDRANQKLKFIDSNFQYISSHELPEKPWAVCARGVDVYVTMGNTHIEHLFVKDMIIESERTIDVRGRCLGICIYGEYIAVGLQTGEIALLNTIGETRATIQLPTEDNGKRCNPWHLCPTKEGNVLVTDSDGGVVFCINMESEIIFKYNGVSSPRATAIDISGNIVIAGRDNLTGDVLRILQHDMELQRMLHIEDMTSQWRSLMTWEKLEFVPYCLCHRHDRVIVIGGIQDTLKIMWLC